MSPSLKEKDGIHAIHCKQAVAVLAYTLLDNGEIDKVGIVTENNPHFAGGKYSGTIMGRIETEDSSLISRAQAELKEEAGVVQPNHEKWMYLGELVTSKLIPDPIYCFACDITGQTLETPMGDGSVGEIGIEFELRDINKALKVNDSVLHFCFFTLFRELYKEQFKL